MWQRRRGTTRVVLAISAFSILTSMVLCYGAFLVIYRDLMEGGIAGILMPILVPACVAPLASYQLATTLGMASELIDELEAARTALQDEVNRRIGVQGELERLARHDPLTGVLNRRGFFESLDALESEQTASLTLATIDVDRFKSVNDTHGHATGDRVLKEVAARLVSSVDGALVARLGGDEFVLGLFGGHADVAAIRAALELVTFDDVVDAAAGDPLEVRCSVGAAAHSLDRTVDATLALADAALYRHKEQAHRLHPVGGGNDSTADPAARRRSPLVEERPPIKINAPRFRG